VSQAPDIDHVLLSFCEEHWLKVARIVGKTMDALERRGVQMDGGLADQIDARMAVLVGSMQLEARGDICQWRYSEVRLPGQRVIAAE
jgi:hypothetical protein